MPYAIGMEADREALRELILAALERERMTVRQFARVVGVSHGTIVQIQNKRTVPDPETCVKLAPWFHLTEDEVLVLAGHRPQQEAPQPLTRDQLMDRLLAVDATEVPFYAIEASASPGHAIFNDEPADYGYLPERRRYRKGRVRGLTIRGNCLAPRIVDGDRVFIDTQPDYEDDDIVLAVVDEALHLKRLRSSPDGWLLVPDNGEPPIPVEIGVHLLGKYLGLWRR